jgi:hypothetical protein
VFGHLSHDRPKASDTALGLEEDKLALQQWQSHHCLCAQKDWDSRAVAGETWRYLLL